MITMKMTCETCGKTFTLYNGEIIGIPFALLPVIISYTMTHVCQPKRTQ
jgi:hypothetical protein